MKRKKVTSFKGLELRRPNGTWQVGHAERWVEKYVLRIPAGCIKIGRPDGQPTKPTDTIGSLCAAAKPKRQREHVIAGELGWECDHCGKPIKVDEEFVIAEHALEDGTKTREWLTTSVATRTPSAK